MAIIQTAFGIGETVTLSVETRNEQTGRVHGPPKGSKGKIVAIEVSARGIRYSVRWYDENGAPVRMSAEPEHALTQC